VTSSANRLKSHSTHAWLFAIAVSLLAINARVGSSGILSLGLGHAGVLLLVLAAVFWGVETRAQRTARANHHDLYADAALLLLWLCCLAFVLLLMPLYVDPPRNRVYEEELGIDLGDALLATIAVCAVATSLILLVRTALDGPVPGKDARVRVFCLGAPVAVAGIAFALHGYAGQVRSALAAYGADLPGPTLFVFASLEYWAILPVSAVALAAYAVVKAGDAADVRRAIAGLVGVLVVTGALVPYFAFAAYMPLFRMCAGPV
jgi:hypothetical protein